MSEQSAPEVLTDYDRKLIEAFAALREHGNERAAARALDLNRTTMTNRLLRYFLRGLDGKLPLQPMPGHVIKGHSATYDADGHMVSQSIKTGTAPSEDTFEVPEGHRVKGVSALLDPNGSVIQQWTKTEVIRGTDQQAILESIRIAAEQLAIRDPRREAAEFLGLTGAPVEEHRPDLMVLHPLADLHLGLYVWGQHCGVAWDLATAVRVFKEVMAELIRRSPPGEVGVILGGGDLLHADDETKKTRRSGHVLDVDSRYEKVLAEAEMLLVYQVELALTKYRRVIVRVLPGNHDDDSSVAVSHFLRAWFRNEPRVTVEVGPGPFFVYEWGATMLGAVHGHEVKIENLKDVLTADYSAMWGRTVHRYCHGFHWHTGKLGDERGGAKWETHQTPVARDAYAHNHGFRSGRSMQTIAYSLEKGECGRAIITL